MASTEAPTEALVENSASIRLVDRLLCVSRTTAGPASPPVVAARVSVLGPCGPRAACRGRVFKKSASIRASRIFHGLPVLPGSPKSPGMLPESTIGGLSPRASGRNRRPGRGRVLTFMRNVSWVGDAGDLPTATSGTERFEPSGFPSRSWRSGDRRRRDPHEPGSWTLRP